MKRRITAMLFFTLACAAGQVATIHGQALNDVRRLLDSGQYQQVIAAGAEDPRVTFLRAQSFEKLSQSNEARQVYAQLAARPESDAWQGVGRSALALASSDAAGALEASNQAVARDGALPEASCRQGLALSANQDFGAAAVAFQKAAGTRSQLGLRALQRGPRILQGEADQSHRAAFSDVLAAGAAGARAGPGAVDPPDAEPVDTRTKGREQRAKGRGEGRPQAPSALALCPLPFALCPS